MNTLRIATPGEAWVMLAEHLKLRQAELPAPQVASMFGVIGALSALRLPSLAPRALAHHDGQHLFVLCLGRHDEVEVEVSEAGVCTVSVAPPYLALLEAAFPCEDVVMLDHLVRQVVCSVTGIDDPPARSTEPSGWVTLLGGRRKVSTFCAGFGTLFQKWLRVTIHGVSKHDLVQVVSVVDVVSSKLLDLAGHSCEHIVGTGDDVIPPCVAVQIDRMRSAPGTFPSEWVALLEIVHSYSPKVPPPAPAVAPACCAPDDGHTADANDTVDGTDDDGIEEGVIDAPATWNNQIGEA